MSGRTRPCRRGDSPVARAKFPYAAPEFSPEQRAERDSIRIANFGSDPIHTAVTGMQQMHGAFDAQILEIRQWRLAEHGPQAARQGPLACTRTARRVRQREASPEIAAGPFLEALDQRIVVGQMIRNDERR